MSFDFQVVLFRDYTFTNEHNEVVIEPKPRPHVVVEIMPGFYWSIGITTVPKAVKIGFDESCQLQTIARLKSEQSFLKDYSLQLYRHTPLLFTGLKGSKSKNFLLDRIKTELSPTSYSGKIIHCSRVPSTAGCFYQGGKSVIILSTTNDNISNNISFVVTPIFSSLQTNDSFPIISKEEMENLENKPVRFIEGPSSLVNQSLFIDLNYIFTYKNGTTWLHPHTGLKTKIFENYTDASALRLSHESVEKLYGFIQQKLTSKFVPEAGSEKFANYDKEPPDLNVDAVEGVFDDWGEVLSSLQFPITDDEEIEILPSSTTGNNDDSEDISWVDEEPSTALDFFDELQKQREEELLILRTTILDVKKQEV